MMTLADLPTLGVGLGFRPQFRSDLFLHQPQVDFLEITADHYLDAPPEKERELELLLEHFTLIPHGLNLSLGSADGLDPAYAQKLAALIQRVNPPWWSEHIAFTHAGGVDIGHLSPLPFTHEVIEVLCRNIATMRRLVDIPLILENITYTVAMPGQEMSEAEFLAKLMARTDCGLLLDVTNLHVNAVNHGYDIDAFLEQIPLERVVQFHFVGVERQNGLLIDSHAQPTPPEVWALMAKIMARTPVKGVILERDENIPAFAELLAELEQVRAIGRSYGRWD